MMTAVANNRHGLLSSLAGFGITFILLYLLSLSHQFLTRRSESQTRISLGPVGGRTEAATVATPEKALSSLQTELQNLQQDPVVSKFKQREIPYVPEPADWTPSQPLDIGATSALSKASIDGLSDGIGPPKETRPNALFLPGAEFPEKLIREGVLSGSALLHIRIDTSGHCKVLKVIEISHTGLSEAIVAAVEKGVFQVPRENGHRKEREVYLPVGFHANKDRVRMIQDKIGKP